MKHESFLSRPRIALPTLLAATLGPGGLAAGQCLEGCTVLQTFIGEAGGDQLGWVSNNVGDLDHDGVNDLVLTAPTNDGGGFNAGRIYVHSGATGDELWRATGSGASWWLGHDANTAGDMNGDGTLDVIAGAPFSGAGRAIVYSGVDGTVLRTLNGEAAGDQFGFRVHGGGDINGDGNPDLVIGAPEYGAAGRAYVYLGPSYTLVCSIDGFAPGDKLGSGVSFVGDISQPPDGRDDIAVGSMDAGPSDGGLAFVYSMPLLACEFQYVLNPGSGANNFGQWFMNGGHDVDGDGTPDMYVNDFSVNRAHVFSGVDGSPIWTLTGDGNGGFGIGRLEPDVNGDGHADLVLAAWVSGAAAPQGGKTFIYSGKDASVLETFTHTVAGAGFGFDANGMGDVDGDGRDDWLITAALDNANANRGRAFLIAGTVAPSDFNGDGVVGVDDLVTVIENWGACPGTPCPGDANGDGVVDVNDLVLTIQYWSS